MLHKEEMPLGLVSRPKTKVQSRKGWMETVQFVHACSEVMAITRSFTYLGSVGHKNGGSWQRIGLSHNVMNLINTLALSVFMQVNKDLNHSII